MEIQFDRIPVDKKSCSCVVQIHTRTFQIILGGKFMYSTDDIIKKLSEHGVKVVFLVNEYTKEKLKEMP